METRRDCFLPGLGFDVGRRNARKAGKAEGDLQSEGGVARPLGPVLPGETVASSSLEHEPHGFIIQAFGFLFVGSITMSFLWSKNRSPEIHQ